MIKCVRRPAFHHSEGARLISVLSWKWSLVRYAETSPEEVTPPLFALVLLRVSHALTEERRLTCLSCLPSIKQEKLPLPPTPPLNPQALSYVVRLMCTKKVTGRGSKRQLTWHSSSAGWHSWEHVLSEGYHRIQSQKYIKWKRQSIVSSLDQSHLQVATMPMPYVSS